MEGDLVIKSMKLSSKDQNHFGSFLSGFVMKPRKIESSWKCATISPATSNTFRRDVFPLSPILLIPHFPPPFLFWNLNAVVHASNYSAVAGFPKCLAATDFFYVSPECFVCLFHFHFQFQHLKLHFALACSPKFFHWEIHQCYVKRKILP